MSEFIKCQFEECNNVTTDYEESYGAYCFKHSKFTICQESKPIKEKKIKSPKRVKTPTRRTRSPKKYKPIETIKCLLCERKIDTVLALKCGHCVCDNCINFIRTDKCPACGMMLEGPLINENIKKLITQKMYEDILKQENE